jgi:hypothetical protein
MMAEFVSNLRRPLFGAAGPQVVGAGKRKAAGSFSGGWKRAREISPSIVLRAELKDELQRQLNVARVRYGVGDLTENA